jgi:hypothetical protein
MNNIQGRGVLEASWWIRSGGRKVRANEVEKDEKYERKEGKKKKDKH